ncbi:trehalose-6-phosphate synthase [Breoghania sp. L-A4]|uniref:alpha,alpha-trehalose-phosphate synthase (UDP-forming) n=1 Tax=Breoghania sp. L-A4 TaxID=2304600 RepID=UPI000E358EFA|nr:trehalose-6-phosphate synthase [Breoghania sp. L-A4]AXS41961.1 trehalose-6-phosphate synthase [Breoghania sp. L-A4]
MTRLVVVSNRVGPLRDTGKAGGLAVGLVDALKQRGGLWFGWSGRISEEGTFGVLHNEGEGSVELATIDLTQQDYDEFYAGYANRALWPALHYRLDLVENERHFEDGYRRVNQRFATRLKALLRADDILWVHDYHFIPLGGCLRAMGVENPIGYFLHVPFPGPDVLTALRNANSLVRELLAYDLVGFQTAGDCGNFRRYVREELGGGMREGGLVEGFARKTVARAYPIGIDTAGFAEFAGSPIAKRHQQRLARAMGGQPLIIGVDRLDYTKGIPQRLNAFARLLEDYPEHRGHVSFMQIAPLSRSELDAYADIRRELTELTGAINARFSDMDWTPVRLMFRSFARMALAGIYRESRIGLVTPLRDGMNLVAKEFVAAQDPDDPGVLILSRFAGAAEELKEALIVNPFAEEEVVEALQRALRMKPDERKQRWKALFGRLATNDANAWSRRFLADLAGTTDGQLVA